MLTEKSSTGLEQIHKRPAFLQSQPQLFEIVVNSVKDRQANGFASQIRIGAFHSRFDYQFHGIVSSSGNEGQDIRPFPWTHQSDTDSSHGLDRSPSRFRNRSMRSPSALCENRPWQMRKGGHWNGLYASFVATDLRSSAGSSNLRPPHNSFRPALLS